jgi:hypothetical protein
LPFIILQKSFQSSSVERDRTTCRAATNEQTLTALAASEPVELFGLSFDVLTLEALIASKRAAGRPKDLLVLPELEALREATEE